MFIQIASSHSWTESLELQTCEFLAGKNCRDGKQFSLISAFPGTPLMFDVCDFKGKPWLGMAWLLGGFVSATNQRVRMITLFCPTGLTIYVCCVPKCSQDSYD